MASGEAEPLQYTITVLRVSIHCEGCKKKVKKVLQNIEGVYKVAIDAAQHKVTVTSSVGADALIRRLHKSGKQATLWPSPAVAAAKKPEEVAAAPPAAAPPAGESGKGADKAEKKAKEAAKETEAETSEKDKVVVSEKAEVKKPKDDAKKEGEVAEKTEKGGSPAPPKEAAADEEGGEESGGKKGKKKKNKQKDAGEVDAPPAPAEKPAKPQAPSMPTPAPALSPERPHGEFPYYAPPPVMSYNVAHPSSSVSYSYYAPTPIMSMQPTPMPPPPPQLSYGYSPYPPMMPPPPEYLYGPPGMRSSPPQESYNNMFNEENPNSCSIM
ncbi:hypothetical protein ABZP36_000901 [Zizania latifolia]